ncbi:MAG: hypothetical protein FD170_2892 [Bacteroidetes bacterium]|nr:MAG: hypothetical protein FD170_2892 [Bacteroidota bacterium]
MKSKIIFILLPFILMSISMNLLAQQQTESAGISQSDQPMQQPTSEDSENSATHLIKWIIRIKLTP